MALTGVFTAAHAVDFETLELNDASRVLIALRGEIRMGDYHRFALYFRRVAKTYGIVGVALDSPGGNVVEASRFANYIHAVGVAAVILPGGECASACFLLFAASPVRYAARDAKIDVHSAAMPGGEETLLTMGITTEMARDAVNYGVPPEIIGRMVSTEPDDMSWLTLAEEQSMGIHFIGGADGPPVGNSPPVSPPEGPAAELPHAPPSAAPSAAGEPTLLVPRQAAGQESASLVPDPSLPPRSAPPMAQPVPAPNQPGPATGPPAFQQGVSDRRAWEKWIVALHGDYYFGAVYWALRGSLPDPGPCQGVVATKDDGSFTAGCLAAKARLARLNALPSDPDYYAAWKIIP
jgi:ATP-dependent protease ClpP protease subunit